MPPEDWRYDYLSPDANTFWTWNPEGDAVLWWNGETLTIYQELDLAVRQLQSNGLPRFEELLLVIAATRRNWADPEGGARHFTGKIEKLDPQGWKDFPIYEWLKPLFDGLNRVQHVAQREGFGSGVTLKLLSAVFAGLGDAVEPDDADELAGEFASGQVSLWARQNSRRTPSLSSRNPPLSLLQTVRNLVEILAEFDESTDLNLIETTGLPSLVSPAELEEIPGGKRLGQLVEELLREEGELQGLATLVRQLGAVINLPRKLSDPIDQPLGGYSDIANRGSMDRLFVSELAQDPEVLAVRVALNEALYIRRESPPKEPPRHRLIFVDVGIRMWGVSRVCAIASAMAFAWRIEPEGKVEVIQGRGDHFVPCDVGSREGIVDLMAQLRPEPHPGAALAKVFADPGSEDTELIVITTERVWKDPQFRNAISDQRPVAFHVALVDRDGTFELREANLSGERVLQRARLEIDLLLTEPEHTLKPRRLISDSDELPLFVRMKECPLRMGFGVAPERAVYHHRVGLLAHTADGLLSVWKNPELGGQLVTTEFPKGRPVWAQILAEVRAACFLFVRNSEKVELFEVGLDSGKIESTHIDLPFPEVEYVYRVGRVILLFNGMAGFAFQLGTGKCLGRTRLPGTCAEVSDQFIRCGRSWYAMRVDSIAPDTKERPAKSIPLNASGSSVLAFERVPIEGGKLVWNHENWPAPLALDGDFHVLCLDHPPVKVAGRGDIEGEVIGLSSDRERVFLRTAEGRYPPGRAFDVLRNESANLYGRLNLFDLEPEAARISSSIPNVRRHFTEIYLSPPTGLHLMSKSQTLLTLKLDGNRTKRICWDCTPAGDYMLENGWITNVNNCLKIADWNKRIKAQEFESVPVCEGRLNLAVMGFPDGSKVWLDRRGMLHLRSSNKGIPQISIVLQDGGTSGWCSNGDYFGARYFIGHRKSLDESAFFQIQKFVSHIFSHLKREERALGKRQTRGADD